MEAYALWKIGKNFYKSLTGSIEWKKNILISVRGCEIARYYSARVSRNFSKKLNTLEACNICLKEFTISEFSNAS